MTSPDAAPDENGSGHVERERRTGMPTLRSIAAIRRFFDQDALYVLILLVAKMHRSQSEFMRMC
jgi:hypothetical protein